MSGESVKLTSGSTIADLHRIEVIGNAEYSDVDSTPVMKVDTDTVQTPSCVEELVNGVHDSVPESACLALTRILMDHLDVFSQSDNDLGRTDIISHHIETADAKSVPQSLPRFPSAHVESTSKRR